MASNVFTPDVAPRPSVPPAAEPGVGRRPRHGRHPRSRARTFAIVAAAVLGALLVLALIALAVVHHALPGWIRHKVITEVHSKCPACTVEIDGVQVGWGTGLLRFQGVHYASDPNNVVSFELRADEVDLDLAVPSLWRDVKHVERLELWGARVRVRQDRSKGHGRPGPTVPESPPLERQPPLRVDSVAVRDGVLTFTDRVNNQDARVTFSDIDLDVGAVGTRRGLAPEETEVRGSALLADSGRLTLRARVQPMTPTFDAHYELGLQHLSLGELEGFLSTSDGIHVTGTVVDAHASMGVRGRSVHGTLRGTYRGLNIHFDEGHGRGAGGTLLANVGEDLLMDEGKGHGPGDEAPTTLDGHRGEHQAYFDFVWTALRDGIMQYIKR